MRLILVRHGQTPANVIGALDTASPGPGLTGLGEAQAAALPRALEGQRISGLSVSTLIRTQLTATPLAATRALQPVVFAGLREIEAGSLEGHTGHTSQMEYLSTAFAWARGMRETVMPGGPDGHAFFARFDAAIKRVTALTTATGTAVAVSHGMAIRTWVAATAVNLDGDFAAEHHLGNTGMVVLETTPSGGWTMLEWIGTPAGGVQFDDPAAEDPTGDSLAEARSEIAK